MKKANILYWILNGLFAFLMLGSAIPDILVAKLAVDGMHGELGYPVYFIPFIGIAKLLGVIAILFPRFPRLKEWAYAGFMFDLVGATYSIAAAGKTGPDLFFMALPLALACAAYASYRWRERLRSGN